MEALKLSLAIPGMGLLLRMIMLATAERRLDCDEAMTGIMSLDIATGRNFPMFFYGNGYNGGAAFEAYLSAAGIAIVYPSVFIVKLAPTLIWFASALFFASLCNQVLSGSRRWLAVTFYCFGTPFFIEWSMTARGGYVETLLVSVLLLWLTDPPMFLAPKWWARTGLFGVLAGLSFWSSEMIVPFLPCAVCWFLYRTREELRLKTLGTLVISGFAGLLPLIGYGIMNPGDHLKQSLVYGLLMGNRETTPLDGSELMGSAAFIFSPVPAAIGLLLILGVIELFRRRRSFNVAHVALAHLVIFGLGYWWSGLRSLPIAPSRVLFVLLPSLSLLVAWSLPESDEQWGRARRVVASLLIVAWFLPAALAVSAWSGSGLPRSNSSWRGTWAFTDGDGIAHWLLKNRVDTLYVDYWSMTPIMFALRSAALRGEEVSRVSITIDIPSQPLPAGGRAALALNKNSPGLAKVTALFAQQGIDYARIEIDNTVILSELDSSVIHMTMGLPRQFNTQDAFAPLPESPDGFN